MKRKKSNQYGYCPKCGARCEFRERRPNGDDRCRNGHKYPSAEATKEPITGIGVIRVKHLIWDEWKANES